MVLKLYGLYESPYVRLVATVLSEKKVPFELVLVNLAKGEHKTPDYLDKHPYGQVPYIVCFLCNLQFPIQLLNTLNSFRDFTRTTMALSSTKAKQSPTI